LPDNLKEILSAKVLLVDDAPEITRLLEAYLKAEGYTNIRSVTDPRRAESIFMAFQPDLVVLDIMMPHMNGFQLMEKFKQMNPEGYISVLILTAQQDHETRIKALR